MFKKLFAFILILFLFSVPISSALAALIFQDVGDNYLAKKEFDFLVEQGILDANPAIAFEVNEKITRIQAVELLVKALKLPLEDRPIPTFADVAPEDEKLPLIAAIVDEYIMYGNENNEFRPNDPLSRAQTAVILVKAFQLSGTTTLSFKDVPPTFWAYEPIQTLITNKITTGYSTSTFQPNASITKSNFTVLLARTLNPEFRKELSKPAPKPDPVSCEKPSKTKKYKVNVQVTSLWNKPNMARKVDRASTSVPVDITKWTKTMNQSQKWWLVEKTDTQALYGDEVTLIKSSGNWIQVAATDQYVPYNKAGYPGWVPKTHIKETSMDYTDCSIAIVKAKVASLYEVKTYKHFMNISYSTILPVLKEEGNFLHVQTPSDGVKLIKKAEVKTFKNYASIPKPTQKDIVNEAKRFLDLPYLWAGTSAFGFDCSGIIFSVYKNHGILIPRDSFYQATKGTAVSKSKLEPGDLIFFASGGGRGKVYHVGLYIGDGKMLHAPNASSKVKIESINAGVYKRNYAGARRYLN